MLRTIIWFSSVTIFLILVIPLMLVERLLHRKYGEANWSTKFAVRVFVGMTIFFAGLNIHRQGEENILEGPALYIGNHQGLFDIALILHELGPLKAIVAKDAVKKIPCVYTWMKCFDCIFIERGDARKGLEAINAAQDLLEHGRSVIIFPEGTRSRGPELGEFKHGAVRAAVKAGVPVVPFAIDGTWHSYEEFQKVRPADIQLSILPAIPSDGKKSAQLAEEAKAAIQAELDRLRAE